MDSGQDGNGFVGANGSNQFGGASVSGNLNNSQVQTPQGVVSSGNNVVAGGSGAVPTQPTIASGGGDIVLSSGEQKSGKGPKWVIGVIVGILVLVGIGVGIMLLVQPRSGGSSGEDGAGYVKKFNIYANYLLFGEKSNKEVGDFDASSFYFVDEKYNDELYMRELSGLYEEFYEAQLAEGVGLSPNVLLFSAVEENLEFLTEYSKIKFINLDVLYERYVSDGEVVARSYVEDFYEKRDAGNSITMMVERKDREKALYYIEYWKTGEMPAGSEDVDNFLDEIISESIGFIKKQSEKTNSIIKDGTNED